MTIFHSGFGGSRPLPNNSFKPSRFAARLNSSVRRQKVAPWICSFPHVPDHTLNARGSDSRAMSLSTQPCHAIILRIHFSRDLGEFTQGQRQLSRFAKEDFEEE